MLRSKLHSVVRLLRSLWAAFVAGFVSASVHPTRFFPTAQACFTILCDTWDAPALDPNWSSLIYVGIVVVSLER